jgi:hypothetical protein
MDSQSPKRLMDSPAILPAAKRMRLVRQSQQEDALTGMAPPGCGIVFVSRRAMEASTEGGKLATKPSLAGEMADVLERSQPRAAERPPSTGGGYSPAPSKSRANHDGSYIPTGGIPKQDPGWLIRTTETTSADRAYADDQGKSREASDGNSRGV